MERSHLSSVVLTLAALLVLGCCTVTPANAAFTVRDCGTGGVQTLVQIRDKTIDLVVKGPCCVNGTIDNGRTSLLFVFHNVNVINGGKPIDFWAESILIENHGELTAVSSNAIPGYSSRMTIHLWGAPNDEGIACQTKADSTRNIGPCGIPLDVWIANPIMAHNLAMDMPPPPSVPKNVACKSLPGHRTELPGDDCFYQYEVQDAQDRKNNRKAYFGHKVVAVSFGGTLQLEGAKGSTFGRPPGSKDPPGQNQCSVP